MEGVYELGLPEESQTPSMVYDWWDCDDSNDEWKKRKKHKKKKKKRKKAKKRAKQKLKYQLIEKSVGTAVLTASDILKMYAESKFRRPSNGK